MNAIANIPKPPCNTLSGVVEEYLINRQINLEKYFVNYMVIAKRSWQSLFWKTLQVIRSEWMTIQAGEPYNFVYVPKGSIRVLSISIVDHHNKIRQLFYNAQLNTIPQPTVQSCGCQTCGCTGAQDELSGLTYSTVALFTINGVTYYEKIWSKLCSNGDVIQYREVPTKKYKDFIGNSGDFNNDFNSDFSNGNAGSNNFEIVTQSFQTKLCSLTTAPCGCPEPTQENAQLIQDYCGCGNVFWGWWGHRRERKDFLFDNVNNNEWGEVKMSDCGTKIYYRPGRKTHHTPVQFLLVSYQTSGLERDIDGGVSVPDYCIDVMMADIDWRSKRFNNKYNISEKKDAEYRRNDEVNKLIGFLNPLSQEWLQNLRDMTIKW